ncbi:MAG TPA: hypothetical protein VII38_20565, partial [Polyangia bacterium]
QTPEELRSAITSPPKSSFTIRGLDSRDFKLRLRKRFPHAFNNGVIPVPPGASPLGDYNYPIPVDRSPLGDYPLPGMQ